MMTTMDPSHCHFELFFNSIWVRFPPKDCNSFAFSGCGEGKIKQKTATPEAMAIMQDLGKKGKETVKEVGSGKEMYLAKGLGVECCGDGIGGCRGGGGGDHNPLGSGGNDGDRHAVEEYYKKMVKENPGDPLFLRNYANFL